MTKKRKQSCFKQPIYESILHLKNLGSFSLSEFNLEHLKEERQQTFKRQKQLSCLKLIGNYVPCSRMLYFV